MSSAVVRATRLIVVKENTVKFDALSSCAASCVARRVDQRLAAACNMARPGSPGNTTALAPPIPLSRRLYSIVLQSVSREVTLVLQ